MSAGPAEMQRRGRSLTLSFVTVMAITNGILFTALTLVYRSAS